MAILFHQPGDAVSKGCGRTFEEVQLWPQMTPVEKRATGDALRTGGRRRFNKYADRAVEGFGALSNQ
ncbi:DUF1289 domain-containing protein [Candidatus Aalborgicola defluviihabitans]|uniref:DUF1289 domain-containing protein n=1 Tax=Candidatus Aalborgicola defluviihabitans TaxID=3386187 RepID=UPI0039B8D3DB